MMPAIDMSRRRFGSLVVLRRSGTGAKGSHTWPVWLCVCDCGKQVETRGASLRNGTTKSCGCRKGAMCSAANVKHGGAIRGLSPEYLAWRGMLDRCYRKTHLSYPNYGLRGIRVAPRWRNDFAAFLADVGRKPTPAHSLDRFPNNDGNYEPGNVRWATNIQQGRNKRTNRLIEHDGRSMPLSAWSEFAGIPSDTIAARLERGWSTERAITSPILERCRR